MYKSIHTDIEFKSRFFQQNFDLCDHAKCMNQGCVDFKLMLRNLGATCYSVRVTIARKVDSKIVKTYLM